MALALLWMLAAAQPAVSASTGDGAHTYPGPAFGDVLAQAPTTHRQQSHLWFHDGAWWGLLVSPHDGGVHVAELMPDHSWRITDTVTSADPDSVGDALSHGDQLIVVGPDVDEHITVSRMTYDSETRNYAMDPGFPVEVQGSSNAMTVARDSTGALWVAFTTTTTVRVLRSVDEGRSWSLPFDFPPEEAAIARGNVAAVVAFDESIGVMWSDEARGSFRFAVHQDGAPMGEWRYETALEGDGMSDDHLSLKILPGEPDTVFAAVKTGQGDRGEAADQPLIMLLRRTPDGSWTKHVVATVADGHSRPTLLLDTTNEVVHVFAQFPQPGGVIYRKSASLRDLQFPVGRGSAFMQEGASVLADATGTKDPVNARTGIVLLASDQEGQRYEHGEMRVALPEGQSLPGAQDDTEPPSQPGDVRARTADGAVLLSWPAVRDGEGWWPDANGVPVSRYVIARNGEEIATTERTTFRDTSVRGDVTYEYAVAAVDHGGNSSPFTEPVSVLVEEPRRSVVDRLADASGLTGLGGAALLITAFGVFLRLWWREHRRIEV